MRKRNVQKNIRYLLGGFFLFSVILFYIWETNQVMKLGYEINQLKKELMQTMNQNKVIRTRVNSLRSYERIETLAIEKIGLTKPVKSNLILLTPNDK